MFKKTVFLILLLLSVLFVPATLLAFDQLQSGENIILERDKVINSDYFGAGEAVTVSGTVNGDAYVAGGKVIVDGTINGDLLVAGGSVQVRGNIAGNVRAAGGEIIVTGVIGRNLTATGGSVNLADTAKITGNVVSGAGDLNVYSEIGGDLTAGAGNLIIGNKIGKTVYAGVEQLTIASSAQILGDINYWSQNDGRVEQGAQLSGKTNKFTPSEAPNRRAGEDIAKFFVGLYAVYKIITLISALIIGFLLIKFAPIYTQKTVDLVVKKPGNSFLVGLISLILTPILFIILLLTVVGIPLAFILLASYLILIYFSKIIIAVVIGQKVFSISGKSTSLIWALVVGLIIYAALVTIPVLGWVAGLFAIIFGLGGLISERYSCYKGLRSKNLI